LQVKNSKVEDLEPANVPPQDDEDEDEDMEEVG
jgi:hypothetical protein